MNPRPAYPKKSPATYEAMLALQATVDRSPLEPSLRLLVQLRASQLNGCAFCLDMHATDALAAGEDPRRLHLIAAHPDAGVFTPREQAALSWTEVVTRLPDGGIPDAAYESARAQFTEEELVTLTLAVVTINGWNRLNVAFRTPPAAPRRE
jgi:AhpD family alkylhydroperoxidase